MGTFIILLSILAVGIVLLVLGFKKDNSDLQGGSVAILMFSFLGLVISGSIALRDNVFFSHVIEYQRLSDTYDAIIIRLSGNGGFVASLEDYTAAVDYNTTIREENWKHDNFFLNCFDNELIVHKLDYIDISQYTISYTI